MSPPHKLHCYTDVTLCSTIVTFNYSGVMMVCNILKSCMKSRDAKLKYSICLNLDSKTKRRLSRVYRAAAAAKCKQKQSRYGKMII